MIIRRFIEHVREQNWFAVGLDMCVVIVGIFLGMQVTEWNEVRKERGLEEEYLIRLQEDAKFNRKELISIRDMHEGVRARTEAFIRYVVRQEPDGELHKAITQKSLRSGLFPDSEVRTGTYDEIVSSGNITLLKNNQLKALLRQFAAELKRTEGQLQYSRSTYITISKQVDRSRKLIANEEGDIRAVYNLDHLIGDEAFLEAATDLHRRHELMARFYAESVETVTDIINTIDCEMQTGPCSAEEAE